MTGISKSQVSRLCDSHFVKASGLRWMSLMLLSPIPWAGRVWALPFLTALVPSERACRDWGRRHKPLLDVGRQLALQARRWLPGRDLVLVGDSGFSTHLFLDAMRRARITAVTRLRLDAALYEPAPPRLPGTVGRPRTKGARLPTLAATLAANHGEEGAGFVEPAQVSPVSGASNSRPAARSWGPSPSPACITPSAKRFQPCARA